MLSGSDFMARSVSLAAETRSPASIMDLAMLNMAAGSSSSLVSEPASASVFMDAYMRLASSLLPSLIRASASAFLAERSRGSILRIWLHTLTVVSVSAVCIARSR